MNRLRFVVGLTNDDNDYQIEQAASAENAARKLNVDLQMLHAQNDGIVQSQQLLKIVHADQRPDAIIFEPAGGTALPQVARAAAAAGIGWVVLNRETGYIAELRSQFPVPSFAITSDHEEIGRIQGRQIAALVPQGGSVLYIQGPAESLAAKQRTVGMYETKPANIEVKLMKAQWTEISAHKAVSAWLKLTTSRAAGIEAIVAQDDSMAMGARKAFHDLPEGEARTRWLSLPFIGCDGLPKTGQAWVRGGMLAATIFTPPTAGLAIEMMAQALQGQSVSERTLVEAVSIPGLDVLEKEMREKARASARASAARV
ncbi:MAG: substrate-binding domain-containing protein [Terriglobales bacterium]|jgi:ABC-type sugar transport system substrate-binding protein